MAENRIVKAALTGSIAMGKSTVAQMFRDANVPVFDADAAVHQLYARHGEAVEPVGAVFPDVIKQGAIDRGQLARHVLQDAAAMAKLESIVHPLVRQQQEEFLESAVRAGHRVAVFDIPLLFETGRSDEFDVILVVSAPAEVQTARALERPDMTQEKLDAILARQVPDADKRARATHIVSTGVPLEDTRRQVLAIITELQSLAGEQSHA